MGNKHPSLTNHFNPYTLLCIDSYIRITYPLTAKYALRRTTGTIQRAVNRRIVRLNCTLQMNHRHGTNSHNRIDRRAVHQVLHHDQKGRDSAQSLEDRYEAQRKQRHFEARRREPDQLVDNVLLLRRSTRITLQSRPSRPRVPGGVVSHRLHNGPVHARTKLATGEMQTEERLGR